MTSRRFDLAQFGAVADGVTDDTPALARCFEAVGNAGGGVVTIPPGAYFVTGMTSIPLPSHTTVLAHGATFVLPERLGDKARVVVFTGCDLVDFRWHGGRFLGHCFDPAHSDNTWETNANTRIFAVTTSRRGTTAGLLFRDLAGESIAGAVVNVSGCRSDRSERDVDTYASSVSVESCNFTNCGKLMWDYGFLWQRLVWPDEYTPAEVALAERYFIPELIRSGVTMKDGDDRVWYDSSQGAVPADTTGGDERTLCFCGDRLPSNVVRGKKYHIVDSGGGFVRVAESAGGAPLRFAGSAGPDTRFIHSLHQAFYHLYAPHGCGPGKGGVDLVACRNVIVSGCRLSALGDTMHIQACDTTVFSNNHITGARMGAFFLAEWCRNSTVTGNTVDGTNGSRVMSVEKSNENTTIVGNLFRNGGRGSWINQPRNLVMQGNMFVNNTTKCEHDPRRGRKSFETGDYERYPEMYFTLHEQDGTYGPVVLRDNVFDTGPECSSAVTFAPNGHDIVVEGNVFSGVARTIQVDPACRNVHIGYNHGLAKG